MKGCAVHGAKGTLPCFATAYARRPCLPRCNCPAINHGPLSELLFNVVRKSVHGDKIKASTAVFTACCTRKVMPCIPPPLAPGSSNSLSSLRSRYLSLLRTASADSGEVSSVNDTGLRDRIERRFGSSPSWLGEREGPSSSPSRNVACRWRGGLA
jgi:hypothetical protein